MTFTDIINRVYFLTSGTSTDISNAQIAIEANNALDRVTSLIFQSDGRWQFDDTNNTDLPIATANLVSGQQDYSLSVTHLEITRIEVLDSTGTSWTKLNPIDQADIYNQALTAFLNSNGLPTYYDLIGSSIFLYPAPNYSISSGLKVYFKRGPSYFASTDTTKTPGFSTIFHDLIPLWISYHYAIANGKSNAQTLMQEIQMREDDLKTHYVLRNKDEKPSLKARPQSYR